MCSTRYGERKNRAGGSADTGARSTRTRSDECAISDQKQYNQVDLASNRCSSS